MFQKFEPNFALISYFEVETNTWKADARKSLQLRWTIVPICLESRDVPNASPRPLPLEWNRIRRWKEFIELIQNVSDKSVSLYKLKARDVTETVLKICDKKMY